MILLGYNGRTWRETLDCGLISKQQSEGSTILQCLTNGVSHFKIFFLSYSRIQHCATAQITGCNIARTLQSSTVLQLQYQFVTWMASLWVTPCGAPEPQPGSNFVVVKKMWINTGNYIPTAPGSYCQETIKEWFHLRMLWLLKRYLLPVWIEFDNLRLTC